MIKEIKYLIKERKGINSTIALIVTIAIGLMVVIIIITMVNANTGNLEGFAKDSTPGELWKGGSE